MTVLDAYAVLAYLRDEAGAEPVAELLRSPAVLSAVNAAEVIDQLVRVYDRDPDDVHADLAVLSHPVCTCPPSPPRSGCSRAGCGHATASGWRSASPTESPRPLACLQAARSRPPPPRWRR